MIQTKVIIVGGGPAGSSCAWMLSRHRIPAIVLDRKPFPRNKTCAGWITPKVVKTLRLREDHYPYDLRSYRRLNYHFWGRRLPVRTRQYAIRRWELDAWLLKRADIPVATHRVKTIRQAEGRFIVDERFSADYIVGAGGTDCPVYRTLFKDHLPRSKAHRIIALEAEFQTEIGEQECHLWFFDHGLPGYAWYLPKGNGYLNVGLGGKLTLLQERGTSIRMHWERLVEKLKNGKLVDLGHSIPKGCNYYLRQRSQPVVRDNAFIVGDAAGLATVDMGEGIGPAVQSGLLAAREIATGQPYTLRSIGRYSLMDILFPWG